jgi:hypothetical protein
VRDIWPDIADPHWKISTIVKRSLGAQSEDEEYKPTYSSHNSPDGGFEYFVTLGFSEGPSADHMGQATAETTREEMIRRLRTILRVVSAHAGVIVEVERVVGRIEESASEWIENLGRVQAFQSREFPFPLSQTKPFELHHGFDVPKQAWPSQEPITL